MYGIPGLKENRSCNTSPSLQGGGVQQQLYQLHNQACHTPASPPFSVQHPGSSRSATTASEGLLLRCWDTDLGCIATEGMYATEGSLALEGRLVASQPLTMPSLHSSSRQQQFTGATIDITSRTQVDEKSTINDAIASPSRRCGSSSCHDPSTTVATVNINNTSARSDNLSGATGLGTPRRSPKPDKLQNSPRTSRTSMSPKAPRIPETSKSNKAVDSSKCSPSPSARSHLSRSSVISLQDHPSLPPESSTGSPFHDKSYHDISLYEPSLHGGSVHDSSLHEPPLQDISLQEVSLQKVSVYDTSSVKKGSSPSPSARSRLPKAEPSIEPYLESPFSQEQQQQHSDTASVTVKIL